MSTTFHYTPLALARTARAIAERHPDSVTIDLSDYAGWLSQFFRELADTPHAGLRALAARLNTGQVMALIDALPTLDNDDLFDKGAAAILTRHRASILGHLVGLLGRYYEQERVCSMISTGLADPANREFAPAELRHLQLPLTTDSLLTSIARGYSAANTAWDSFTSSLKRYSPSTAREGWRTLPLGKGAITQILSAPGSRAFTRETNETIVDWISDIIRSEHIPGVALNYLTSTPYSNWAEPVITKIVELMGDPRLRGDEWSTFPEQVRKDVARWINERTLKQFFLDGAGDQRRYAFWREFVEHMGPHSVGRVEEQQGFFEFPEAGFGVIEFMATGNAAYIYPLDFYHRMLNRGQVSNGLLKDRSQVLRRTVRSAYGYSREQELRITHSGPWENRWLPIMQQLIGD